MSLASIANVNIQVQSAALSLPGFGRALILPPSVPFAPRSKVYSDPSEMLDDGFLTSDQAYIEAVSLVSQNPRPVDFMVGRRDPAQAMVRTIFVADTTDGTYNVQINGIDNTFVASSSTATAIRDGLVAAINANNALHGVTAAPVSTEEMTLTADTAGIQFVVVLAQPVSDGLLFSQQFDITGTTDGVYTVTIGSTPNSFTASSNTSAEIRDGLVAAINANTATHGVTAAPDGATDATLRDGVDFAVTVAGPGGPDISLNPASEWVANVGIPEALNEIDEFDNDWYLLLITERDDASIESAARAIETRKKIFFAQSSDTAILDAPFDPGNINADIASRLRGLAFSRTALWFHDVDAGTGSALAAAIAGRGLPEIPASITWKFKELAGVAAFAFTTSQLNNLRGNPQTSDQGKRANGYRSLAGRSITAEGTVASGEFIDVVRGIDKLAQDIQSRIFTTLFTSPKVPFTQAGIDLLGADVRAALKASEREGLIAPNRQAADGTFEAPAFSVTTPNVGDISANDRAARLIPSNNPITFEGTLAGAIHVVNISGTVSA